ncbi:MAG: SLBB domain-containing protein [Bacteroidales bacterium]|nr:SLBB domain-containing protein [Bacteroidales bacterium]
MTDDQVMEYVRNAIASGKNETAIGQELLVMGVTTEQIMRVKNNYQEQTGGSLNRNDPAFGEDEGYTRGVSEAASTTQTWEATNSTRQDRRSRRLSVTDKNRDLSSFELMKGALNPSGSEEENSSEESDELQIFGHDVFNGRYMSFEPNENLATPANYTLGPGDQLLIEIFGYSEASYTKTVSPEGAISISQIGQVQVGGLTINGASEKIRKSLMAKYAGLGGNVPNTTVSITLRQFRTIQVNIMGEVGTPGTYRLSPFATVINALHAAGGVTDNGTLRAIKVVRGEREVASVDIYGYLLEGRSDSDIVLKEGDVVLVQPYDNLVLVLGNVKRPMFYETKDGETLTQVLEYAGGFSNKAYQEDFRVIRPTGAERQIYTVKKADAPRFTMTDGDEVYVGETMSRFANKVEIKGAVFRPGMYELGGDIATVRQLVKIAGGPKEDAFTGRAVLVREKEDLTYETLSIDLAGILAGKADDVLLRKNDILTISSQRELNDPGILTINGYVLKPGVFPYADNMTVEDLILLAGGLMDGASLSRVDIARRVLDPYSLMPKDTIGETFSFALKDGLALDGGEHFLLQPYDVVSVRKSPSFRVQKFVKIEGEVAFPGEYVLLSEGERLSELVRRSGGPTRQAFLAGGMLSRVMNEEEKNLQAAKEKMLKAGTGRGVSSIGQITDDVFTVAIDLDKAVAHPGSEYDLILREGDRIYVPEKLSTVKISGDVLYPNTVIYVPGQGVRYYINNAGGYGVGAKKSKTYIVYMNGKVMPANSGSATIEPGCEIVVPQRTSNFSSSLAQVMAMTSTFTSMTTMVATLLNLFKK